MLYYPQRHEALSVIPWDERAARDAIAEIVADTELHFDPVRFWPVHPREDAKGVLKGLWFGAAGTLWALDYLRKCGAASMRLDLADAIARVDAKFRGEEDPRIYSGSFLMGEIGILLVRWRISGEGESADRLFNLIDGNPEHRTDELMWGVPGGALAASLVWEATGEERWRGLFLRKIDAMWQRWEYQPEHRCHLWSQVLYQPQARTLLGPVHGFSGNAAVMMRAASMMTEDRRGEMYDRIAQAIKATAHVEGDCANWLSTAGAAPVGGQLPWLVQWCHGAPGTLAALSAFPKDRDPDFESLFAAAGEMTFTAGPLTKGPNLCHGTGGNGIIFLRLYQRTGDSSWLDRARAFAMHGIEQYRRFRTEYGQGWYALWSGDLGFAVYLQQCVSTGEIGFPTFDFF